MGIVRNVNFKITGQVADDYRDNDYAVLEAELKVICAKYDLELNNLDYDLGEDE